MKVLTYNICGNRARHDPSRLEGVAAVIRAIEPDIVGLQEVYQRVDAGGEGDQPARLPPRAELTGLNPSFGPPLSHGAFGSGTAVLPRGRIRRSAMYRLPFQL